MRSSLCLHRGRFHGEIRAVTPTFVLALMLASLVKKKNETSKNIYSISYIITIIITLVILCYISYAHDYEPEKNTTVFKNVKKCQYDSVKILCFRN